jgi:hypothetical protein
MTTNTWVVANGSGNWSDGNDWRLLEPPGTADTALLIGPGPYTVTLDVPETVAAATVDAGVTLAIASTLTTTGAVAVLGAVDLSGVFAAGRLDLSGGGTLIADGGTLEGNALLGGSTAIGGTGTIVNQGSIGWSAPASGAIAISAAGFTNAGQIVLTPGTQAMSAVLPTGAYVNRGQTLAIDSNLMWSQVYGASVTLDGGNFTNANLIQMQGGTLALDGESFANSGTISLVDATTGTAEAAGATLGVTTYATADTVILGQFIVEAGAGTFTNTGLITAGSAVFAQPTFDNAGTIVAGSILFDATSFDNIGTVAAVSAEFTQAMSLAQVMAVFGPMPESLAFDAGLDLGGGTLTADTIAVSGLLQGGSIGDLGTLVLSEGATMQNVAVGGTGTLELLGGNTLDNVTIDPAIQIVEPAGGTVTLVDPPNTGAAVTLDSVVNELDFKTVSSFDGSIVLGPGASNDVIGVSTPGGVTLGADFALTDSVAGSIVTFANPNATVTNQGNWTLSGASLDVRTSLDGSGTIDLAAGAVLQVATLAGAATFDLNDNATMQVNALAAGATPSVAFGTGLSQVSLPGTGALGAVLSGLAVGDQVDFFSVSSTPDGLFGTGGAAAAGGTLNLQGASGDQASVALAQDTTGLTFNVVPDGNGGSIVVVACFAAGTRIATASGQVPVETLRPGDLVRTHQGRLAPVRWVGSSRVDLARHPQPWRAAPIRIRADAFAPGRPARDLLVSPEHCIFVEGALVPAGMLANGATIARVDGLPRIDYWHVELDRHDILLAEGLPAESYLDTGNRALFAGESGVRALHPDFSGAPDAAALRIWAAHGAAPLRLTAPDVRDSLRVRAEALGWRFGRDAAPSVLADGVAAPCSTTADGIAVRLPPRTRLVRVCSDSFVPAEHEANSGDTRRLGLAVSAVRFGGWTLHPDALRGGWHAPAGEAWRWTNGDAEIVPPMQARPGVLELRLHRLGSYWQKPAGSGERPGESLFHPRRRMAVGQ